MEAASQALQKLNTFLEETRIRKGDPFTHTTKVPSGSYYIGEDSLNDFMTIYCNAVNKGVKTTLTERPGAYGPLRVDFDLKASLDVGLKRQYTEEMLVQIIKFYQEEIKDAVSPEDFEEKMLWCVVLEKKAPRSEEGKVKDGFHLHFPNFICEPWFQDEYLRGRVTEKMLESKIWINGAFLETVDKFIDTNMARKTWMMYGAGKDLKAEPFLATKAYDENGKSITFEKMFEEQMIGRKAHLSYYLPRFLSIRGYNEISVLRKEIDDRRAAYKSRKPRGKTNIVKKRNMEDILADIKIIKDGEIMSMLSDDRADGYETWMDVGWTLFNIGQGCDEALELWIEFSRRSPKFTEGVCEEAWGQMQMRDKTIASILAMAKSDSPDLFKQWKDANVKTFLYRSLYERKPNEWDVAQVIGKLYKDKIICSDAKKDVWWEFLDHRWRLMDDAVALKKLLATEVVNLYYDLKSEIAEQQRKADEAGRVKLEAQEKKCVEIITSLKTCTFQDKVIKMCKIVFHDPIFAKKIDENKHLWVCENGVLDLEICLFRDGRPDDYMSYSCGLNYHRYTKADDEMIELKDFFKKVFTNPNLRRYFKDVACAAMEGGNKNKTFIVGTGGGDNAKSATYGLIETMFGEYCIKFPREMLLAGRGNSSAGARPELARVRGRRLAQIQEIAKDETLSIGVLKDLTGNDTFFARTLFEKGAEIRPMFCLWLACNECPAIPGHDDATWNRVRKLDFETKFVKPEQLCDFPVPSSEVEQFKMKRFKADLELAKRLPELAPVALSMFFERFKKYKVRGLREPEEVRMSTGMYRAVNDVYLQFIQDKIEKIEYPKSTEDKDKIFLKLPDLHSEFTSWYKETHSSYSKEKFDRISLQHEFDKKFGKTLTKKGSAKGWYCYRIIEDEQADDKQQKLHEILAKKIEPVIKKVDGTKLPLPVAKTHSRNTSEDGSSPPSKKKISVVTKKNISADTVSKAIKKTEKQPSVTPIKTTKSISVPVKKSVKA